MSILKAGRGFQPLLAHATGVLRCLIPTAMCKDFEAECKKSLHIDQVYAMESRGNM